jgi:phosphatidylethanolamine/phosphatidyl-N-methylethanolamine N-methyltransferase
MRVVKMHGGAPGFVAMVSKMIFRQSNCSADRNDRFDVLAPHHYHPYCHPSVMGYGYARVDGPRPKLPSTKRPIGDDTMDMRAELDKDTIAKAYARWAPVYDLVFGAVFERGREAAIAAAERIGGRILEVGVGTGISLPDYARTNQLVGVDLSEPMLRKAQERVDEFNLSNVEMLAVMDAERLAFPDDSFDVVVAQYVITTVPNPEATLDEFARVLKPGGEIILVSRVGAEAGLRRTIEHWFQPIARKLGWRTEFPWARFAQWAARTPGVDLIERRAMPPLGHFSLVRFAKPTAESTAEAAVAHQRERRSGT